MQKLLIGYTPDSDDLFNYYAWEHGHVTLSEPGYQPVFYRKHITELNRAAQEGRYNVVAVSAVAYPKLADRYWILCVGNSVGRNFGPALVSKRHTTIEDLHGKRIAVGGNPTTGSVLAMMYCPGIELVEMPYDSIADAIAGDELDAGVMIHEEILYYPERGLRCVCDLGRAWHEDTGLPLPVGLNLVSKRLGIELASDIATTCQHSLLWGFHNSAEVYAFANQFGRGHAKQHVEMFQLEDFLCLPEDVRKAMHVLFDRVASMGIGPRIHSFEVIEGEVEESKLLLNNTP